MTDNGPVGSPGHVPVMPTEVLEALAPKPGQVIVDATVGAGGHARLIAERLGATGRLIGLDTDVAMLEMAKPRLVGLPVTLIHANFQQLAEVLDHLNLPGVDGILADLGFCSDQMDDANRGFSFSRPGPLDMRLDPIQEETAASLIARLSERDLADVIFQYGEERFSRRIARRIVEERKKDPITTTDRLAEIVRRAVPRGKGRIDPATRTFQALRIAVNDELGVLDQFLEELPRRVKTRGRAVIISFHSLEDRRVKEAFRNRSIWRNLTKKPIQASDEEVQINPRARSAKLRAAERIEASEN